MSNRNRKNWKVSSFENTDLPSLGLFFKKHFRSASQYGSMALFQWRAVDNYIMRGIINLIKDGDKIVSTLSNTPKRLYVKGEGCIVAEIGDANTDPQYQRQGMLALLINQSTSDALELGIQGVYSTPDTKTPSLPAFINKANYLPQEGLDIESLIFPLNIAPLVQTRVHWLISQYAGSFFLTFVYLYYLIKKGLSRLHQGLTIEILQSLPDDWDDFWNNAGLFYDFIFERNREALNWRFFRNPNKFKFYVLKDNNRIVGYMVSRIINDEDIKRFIIADYLFLPGYEDHFKVLLLKSFEDALRVGANLISCWCVIGSRYAEILKTFGFVKRKKILLVWFQNEFARILKGDGKWHFTISDSDNV